MKKNHKFLFPLILTSSIIIPPTLAGCSNVPTPPKPTPIIFDGGSLNLTDKQFNAGIDTQKWQFSDGTPISEYHILPVNQAAIDAGDNIFITSSGDKIGKVQWHNLDINTYLFKVVGDGVESARITLEITPHEYEISGYTKIEINNIALDETKELKYHYTEFGSYPLQVKVDGETSNDWALQLGTTAEEQLLYSQIGIRFGTSDSDRNVLYWGKQAGGWDCDQCVSTLKIRASKNDKSFIKTFDIFMKQPVSSTWTIPLKLNQVISFNYDSVKKAYVNEEFMFTQSELIIFIGGVKADIDRFTSVITYKIGDETKTLVPEKQWEVYAKSAIVLLPANAITFSPSEWDTARPETFTVTFTYKQGSNTYASNVSTDISVDHVTHEVTVVGDDDDFSLPEGKDKVIAGESYSVSINHPKPADGYMATIDYVTCGNANITKKCTITKNHYDDNSLWLTLTIPKKVIDGSVIIHCGVFKMINSISLIAPWSIQIENVIKGRNPLVDYDYESVLTGVDGERDLVLKNVYYKKDENTNISIIDYCMMFDATNSQNQTEKHLFIDSTGTRWVGQFSCDNKIYVELKYTSHHVSCSGPTIIDGINFTTQKTIHNDQDYINHMECTDSSKKIVITSLKWLNQYTGEWTFISYGPNGYEFHENNLIIHKEANIDGEIQVTADPEEKKSEGIHGLNDFTLTMRLSEGQWACDEYSMPDLYIIDKYGYQIYLTEENWTCWCAIADYDWLQKSINLYIHPEGFHALIRDGKVLIHVAQAALGAFVDWYDIWDMQHITYNFYIQNKNDPQIRYERSVKVGFTMVK